MLLYRSALALLVCWLSCAHAAPLTREQVVELLKRGNYIGGMHDTLGSPQQNGFSETEMLVGKKIPIWSGDLGFSDPTTDEVDDRTKRSVQLEKMIRLGRRGTMLTLSWHQCSPTLGEPCTFRDGVQGRISQSEWNELLTPGTPLYRRWKGSLLPLFQTLSALQQEGITVLLRPYHESNIPGMWWASGTAEQNKQLFRNLHDEIVDEQKLANVLWVWAAAFHPKYWKDWYGFYPGDAMVDVVGVDVYPPHRLEEPNYVRIFEDLTEHLGRTKPVALTEVSLLPSEVTQHLVRYSYVVPWGINMLKRDNSEQTIRQFYAKP